MFIRCTAVGAIAKISQGKTDNEYQLTLSDDEFDVIVLSKGEKLADMISKLKLGDKVVADCRCYAEGTTTSGNLMKLYVNYLHLVI